MSKRTHKLKGLSDVAAVVAGAPSLGAAAKRLGVDRSTLFRWLKSGKVAGAPPKTGPATGALPNQTPEEWATAVRAMGEIDATRSTLVDLAVQALAIARDTESPAKTKLAAMGRYQQLVKQLNLASESVGASPPAPRMSTPRAARAGGDPRAFLMAVK